jgi:hypothetical protein
VTLVLDALVDWGARHALLVGIAGGIAGLFVYGIFFTETLLPRLRAWRRGKLSRRQAVGWGLLLLAWIVVMVGWALRPPRPG